jgi:Domain of unknown function (DUF4153)
MATATATPASLDPTDSVQPSGFRRPLALAAGGLILGTAFEYLFYGRPLGISFAVWTWLCLAALLVLGWREGVRPSAASLGLTAVVAALSVLPAFRSEPLSVFLDVVLVLCGLALLVRTYRTRDLFSFGFADFGLGLVIPPVEAWFRPWGVLSATQARLLREPQSQSTLAGVGRGVLLAFPILVVFLVLLSSADLVFGDYVRRALDWLDLARFFEYLGRLTVLILSGLFTLGALVLALRKSDGRRLVGRETPLVRPFLGFTESVVVLGAVEALFAVFVAVQFRYLFGGQSNITAAGYTYADYARRGFAELVFLAVLTLGLILALGAWARRDQPGQRAWFGGLSGLLVALTGVILASAFMRLLLYEEAYGFSRLRTYTHVAILWMGLMFLAFLGLLLANRLRAFAVACAIGAFGFGLTLNLLNVDAFIVQQNFANTTRAGELDAAYLSTLSVDSVPPLVERLATYPQDSQAILVPALACDLAILRDRSATQGWPSYRFNQARALAALEPLAPALAAYPVAQTEGTTIWTVQVGDENRMCTGFGF